MIDDVAALHAESNDVAFAGDTASAEHPARAVTAAHGHEAAASRAAWTSSVTAARRSAASRPEVAAATGGFALAEAPGTAQAEID